ncbi:MAG TPA: type 4a pilus biogenesis protein PilO [Pirellulales bacterium]|jgi:Tfp pilus assembly protein PilO|nr:type 4a pilus biogenesis protein PilO [Pirellulales bacterium]
MKTANVIKKRSSWMITIPLAAGAVAYLTWGFFPSMKVLREMRAEIQTQRDFIANAETLNMAAAAAERDLQQTAAFCTAWQQRAPQGKALADFLGRVLALAQSHAAANTRLNPQTPIEFDTLTDVPLLLEVSGSYSEICGLVKDLESLPEAIWVSDLRIEADKEKGKKSTAQLKLDVFAGNREISN